MRRLLPLAVALGVGLCALLWGLAALEGIVLDEREQARDGIASRRATLQEYARRTLEQTLQNRVHARADDFERALHDPLEPGEGLLLVVDGNQRLPRLPDAAPGDDTPAQRLYQRLRTGSMPDELEPGSPSMQRAELVLELQQALDGGEREAIERAMLAVLAHRDRFVIDSAFDLPVTVAMLDDFVERHRPHPLLMSRLLRDGYDEPPGPRIEPLQSGLLQRRHRFSAPDLRFLAERIAALSRQSNVEADDFERAIDPPQATAVPRPARVDEPMLIDEGRWFLAPHSASQQRGVAVALPAIIVDLREEMVRRGLLVEGERLELPLPLPDQPLSALPFEIDAPRLDLALAEAEERFWLKTTFVAATALLALAIVVLAVSMQRRRQRFVELKSDFVATVSHELRTPLASIRLMAETLQRKTRGVPAARDYPQRIVRDIDELAFLVENILSFNRLDKGRWRPRRDAVALGPLVEEVIEDLPQYGFPDVEARIEGVDGITLEADRELLLLLLRNLAKNGCTYNERSPARIEITGRMQGRSFVLEVSDNGVGIPEAEQGQIFDDFRRGAASRARGSGLGLSICRKTMQAHGGRIRIVRSGPEGTRFALEFPATIVQARA